MPCFTFSSHRQSSTGGVAVTATCLKSHPKKKSHVVGCRLILSWVLRSWYVFRAQASLVGNSLCAKYCIVFMTLVNCGSLASGHSHIASTSVTQCLHRRHRLCYFLAQVCKHSLASVLPITSLSIGVVGNCLIGPLIGIALQPSPVPSYSALGVPTREDAPRPEPGICGCGPCFCGEPSASQSQWREIASEGGAYLHNPFWGVRHRFVFVRDSLLYSTRGVSGDSRSYRIVEVVAGRLQAHSSAF